MSPKNKMFVLGVAVGVVMHYAYVNAKGSSGA